MADEGKPEEKTGASGSLLLEMNCGTAMRFAVAAFLLAATLGLMALFSRFSSALFPAYRDFSRGVQDVLSSLFSVLPFSVWPLIALFLTIIFVVFLARCILRKSSLLRFASNALVVVLSLSLFFVGTWGLNHYAPPLDESLDLQVREYSEADLLEATRFYFDEAALCASAVPRGAEGGLLRQDFAELASIAGASYEPLSSASVLFRGSTKPVKLLLGGDILLSSGHNGIYVAVTGEASVPENTAIADMPFTMCHEAAHRLGIASEREANFCAVLACSSSDDVRFRYSGYFKAFEYCYSALASNYPDSVSKVLRRKNLPASLDSYRLVAEDLAATSEHYGKFENSLTDLGTKANDLYLKSFSEESGVKSYGQVVDYLIAWQKPERSQEGNGARAQL